MKPPRDPKNDDMSSEEESDLTPEDQEKQDKKDYNEYVQNPGNYLQPSPSEAHLDFI